MVNIVLCVSRIKLEDIRVMAPLDTEKLPYGLQEQYLQVSVNWSFMLAVQKYVNCSCDGTKVSYELITKLDNFCISTCFVPVT